MRKLMATVLPLLLGACATTPGPAATDVAPPQLGLTAGLETDDLPEVGIIDVPVGAGLVRNCTATLIAADVVLTAAHCFDFQSRALVGERARVSFLQKATESAPPSWLTFELTDVSSFGSALGEDDFALARLATTPGEAVTPRQICPSTPATGTRVSVLGYGSTVRTGGTRPAQGAGRKRIASFAWDPAKPSALVAEGDSGGPVLANGCVFAVNSGYLKAGTKGDVFARLDERKVDITLRIVAWAGSKPENRPIMLSPAGGSRERLAFLGVALGEGFTAKAATTLDEVVAGALGRTGRWEVVGSKDVAAALAHSAQLQVAGCADDSKCLADVAGALQVESLAFATIGKLGTTPVLTMKVVNAKTATALARFEMKVPDESQLVESAEILARECALGVDRKPIPPRAEARAATVLVPAPRSAEATTEVNTAIRKAQEAALSRATKAKPGSLAAIFPLTLTSAGLDAAAGEALDDALRIGLARPLTLLGYTVLLRENTLRLLEDNGIDAAKACESTCPVDAAREIKAQLLVTGKVQRVDNAYVGQATLFGANGNFLNNIHFEHATVAEVRHSFEGLGLSLIEPLIVPDPLKVPSSTPANGLTLGLAVAGGASALVAGVFTALAADAWYAARATTSTAEFDERQTRVHTDSQVAQISGGLAASLLIGSLISYLVAPSGSAP